MFLIEQMMGDSSLHYNPIDLLRNPERISEKGVISTSLIDETHRETWRGGGYILRVPLDIVMVNNFRMFVHHY